ncbi:bifunctional phosphoribosylaminoimidazolecarboxamide formyltransferase/IMP cyclohydrolase [Canibacter sp. lx-72]|uniref:bifunctional phosphoribosylaminoimidazolecarboxamide formyltransferase/IMP cyclohydrolase n=1 Tax=Canibacter zhuwentaonis TaxID=2837491 RepID=UPI001BDD0294|nr:bifunctional phosphoribosylaminoimidazolecarboxamide formyltransferase/IMP cyclohydrolase [Canibacter zhuwentaonis]
MSVNAQNPADYKHRDCIRVKRALISVSDKTGLLQLAAALVAEGVEIVSTGSTAALIREGGYAVTDVERVTGAPEMLDGRVKTLHPAVHVGLLADLRLDSHQEQLTSCGYQSFELVVVNLYPFAETVASGASALNVIENIDVGGPAMVRASAKNHANVAIVVSPASYDEIIAAVQTGGTTLQQRRDLATEAFVHTANYDGEIANWMLEQAASGWAEASTLASADGESDLQDDAELLFTPSEGTVTGYQVVGTRKKILRYGENSHQRAALFVDSDTSGLAQAAQLNGREMSYNNFVDADAAIRAAYDHELPAVAIIKHTNPCGIATSSVGVAQAYQKALACDAVSAFGGVVASNSLVTEEFAKAVAEVFTEVIIAPEYEPAALEILQNKQNLRVLQLPADFRQESIEVRHISGGFLAQETDRSFVSASEWHLVTSRAASDAELCDLGFAYVACRAVKSNAILLAKDQASVGIGMGQVNRVDSAMLAVLRAGDRVRSSVASSDAFFPFADGLQILVDAGVSAVVQPGGSKRDAEVIAVAEAAGIAMYFTGERHFAH